MGQFGQVPAQKTIWLRSVTKVDLVRVCYKGRIGKGLSQRSICLGSAFKVYFSGSATKVNLVKVRHKSRFGHGPSQRLIWLGSALMLY